MQGFGIKLDRQLLIMTARTNGAVNQLFDEMMRINNEQSNLLRKATKFQITNEKESPKLERRHFDELTSLNNQMQTLQRELVKKNLELERLYDELQRLAITDELTGLLNRRGLFDLGSREFERSKRFNESISGLMFDLDHFKSFNDTYGHAVGDEVLREVAVRCTANVRQIDILGRYGGEEFAVILPGTNLANARLMCERLRQAIDSTPFDTSKGPLLVTITLGVATAGPKMEMPEQLLQKADKALYKAKQSGRNCICIAED